MNNNEYIVQPNEKGGYDLILGGVGLGAHETMDLINELKTKGIVPVSAEVTPYINGDVNMPQINDNAQKFTDERLEQNYNMSMDPNAELGLKPSAEEPMIYSSEALEQNYNMSMDPDAEPGLKPSAEEPMIYSSETLEQNYNMSMDPNSEPGLKPIEEGHHKTR